MRAKSIAVCYKVLYIDCIYCVICASISILCFVVVFFCFFFFFVLLFFFSFVFGVVLVVVGGGVVWGAFRKNMWVVGGGLFFVVRGGGGGGGVLECQPDTLPTYVDQCQTPNILNPQVTSILMSGKIRISEIPVHDAVGVQVLHGPEYLTCYHGEFRRRQTPAAFSKHSQVRVAQLHDKFGDARLQRLPPAVHPTQLLDNVLVRVVLDDAVLAIEALVLLQLKQQSIFTSCQIVLNVM